MRPVVALEERLEPIEAGGIKLLTLVVRNDGELTLPPSTLVDKIPEGWRILGASASKGLVSIVTGEVRVSLAASIQRSRSCSPSRYKRLST